MENEIDPFADDTMEKVADGQFFVSDSAIAKLQSYEEFADGQFFRIKVHGGGCAGFRYEFSFDSQAQTDDIMFKIDKITVALDKESLQYLNNSQLDYKKQLIGAYFTINNPLAKSSCGCGMSFSIS